MGSRDVTVSGNPEGLIEHWNGSSWTVQKSAQVSGAVLSLNGVAATSATNAWAVGVDTATGTDLGQTFIERWNGTAWMADESRRHHQHQLPHRRHRRLELTCVGRGRGVRERQQPAESPRRAVEWDRLVGAAQSEPGAEPQDTLAAVSRDANRCRLGGRDSSDSKNVSRSVIERLGAGGWTLQTSPNRGSSNNFLTAVAATSVTNAWAGRSVQLGWHQDAYRALERERVDHTGDPEPGRV